MEKYKLLIAEDHGILRAGLRAMFSDVDDIAGQCQVLSGLSGFQDRFLGKV